MTLEEYLEHLTDNNWHTLRTLIELEQDTIAATLEADALEAYLIARDYLHRKQEERISFNN